MKRRYGMATILVLAAGAASAAPNCKYFGSLCTE